MDITKKYIITNEEFIEKFTLEDGTLSTEINWGQTIQNTLDKAFKNGGGVVIIPPGKYKIKGNQSLMLYPNITLKGLYGKSILDFTERSNYSASNFYNLIDGRGTISEKINLTCDGNINSVTLNCNLELVEKFNLKKGDLICIASDKTYNEPTGNDSSTIFNAGELNTIDYIHPNGVIQLTAPLSDNYLSNNNSNHNHNARIYKVFPIENVKIEGLTFLGQGRNPNPKLPSDLGLCFTYGKNIIIKECEFNNIDQTALDFRSCYEFYVDKCKFYSQEYTAVEQKKVKEINSTTGKTEEKIVDGNIITPIPYNKLAPGVTSLAGKVQYQLRVSDASTRGFITNCYGENGRHFFHTGHSVYTNSPNETKDTPSKDFLFGLCRYITIDNCKAKNTWHAAYSTHNDGEYIKFTNCESHGSWESGFNPRCRNIVIENCRSIHDKLGIHASANVADLTIKGTIIETPTTGGIYLDFQGLEIVRGDIVVQSNIIKRCNTAIELNNPNTNSINYSNIIIKDNSLIKTGAKLISQTSAITYKPAIKLLGLCDTISVENNIISDSFTPDSKVFELIGCKEVTILKNTISNFSNIIFLKDYVKTIVEIIKLPDNKEEEVTTTIIHKNKFVYSINNIAKNIINDNLDDIWSDILNTQIYSAAIDNILIHKGDSSYSKIPLTKKLKDLYTVNTK